MDAQSIKAEIEKIEKRIKNPVLDDNAKKALNNKLEKLKADLKELEGDAKKEEKKVKEEVKKTAEKVEKAAEKEEGVAKEKIDELKKAIEKHEKALKNPIIDENAKAAIKTKLDAAKEELKGLTEKKPAAKKAPAKKKPAEKKVTASLKEDEYVWDENGNKWSVDSIEEEDYKLGGYKGAKQTIKISELEENLKSGKWSKKPVEKKEEKKEEKPATRRGQGKSTTGKKAEKPAAKKEAKAKPAAAKPKKTDSPTVEIKGKTLSVEDCKEVLEEWEKRRKKAKASQKKSNRRSVSTRVAANAVQGVETAVNSVPAEEIAENPEAFIKKVERLKKAAKEFLDAFKAVLGDEYSSTDINEEFEDLDTLIKDLMKKYED